MKLSGTCGSVSVRLIPAPRGTGLVAAPASKKILAMAGLEDCYSTTRGHSRTTGNFITAVFNAVSASYGYLSPELWKPTAKLQRHHFILWTLIVVESRKFDSLIFLRTGLLESAVPGAHRLPRQGGRVGQGRRSLLGSRQTKTGGVQVSSGPPHERGARPSRSIAYRPARKWSNNPNKNQGIVCILTRGRCHLHRGKGARRHASGPLRRNETGPASEPAKNT